MTITSMKRIPSADGSTDNIELSYTLSNWDENDKSTSSVLGDELQIGFGYYFCTWNMGCPWNTMSILWTAAQYPALGKAKTKGELGAALRSTVGFPYSGRIIIRNMDSMYDVRCFTVMAKRSSQLGSDIKPLFSCPSSQALPPKTHSCNFDNNNLELNHGTLNADKVGGHSATGNLRVRCTANMTVVVRLTGASAGKVKLNNGTGQSIDSSLAFAGQNGTSLTTTTGSGGKDVALVSTLSAMDISNSGGKYSGSAVVTLEVP
nr:hypothetical protein [Serratia fonticola]